MDFPFDRPLPRRTVLMVSMALAAAAPVRAQTLAPDPNNERPGLVGRTLEGKPFALDGQRGKVVMVVFWSTNCAVCRDTLQELRANYAGWARQPFELVTVATDARRQDVADYDLLIERIVPRRERFPALWRGESGHRDDFGPVAQLPAAFVVDRSGRVVERFTGRIPPEAWDRVADLMP
jgi:thiol-disulfide isomerase/thioredoxin